VPDEEATTKQETPQPPPPVTGLTVTDGKFLYQPTESASGQPFWERFAKAFVEQMNIRSGDVEKMAQRIRFPKKNPMAHPSIKTLVIVSFSTDGVHDQLNELFLLKESLSSTGRKLHTAFQAALDSAEPYWGINDREFAKIVKRSREQLSQPERDALTQLMARILLHALMIFQQT